jgi:predicted small secreted protein
MKWMRCVVVLVLATGILALSGCNTMEGFGKDLKTVGSKIEKKAEEKK